MGLPPSIIKNMEEHKTSLGDNPALPPSFGGNFLIDIVSDYYEEVSSYCDITDANEMGDELSRLLTICQKMENESKGALEELCIRVVNDIFHIPNDTILIDSKLVDYVDVKKEKLLPERNSDFSFEDIEDMNQITGEIYKRRMLNSIILGCAMFYASKIGAYASALERINPALPELYERILSINDVLMFHITEHNPEERCEGGNVDVYMTNDQTPVRIEAEGLIFPVLLEETIRGLLELAITHGLPKNIEKAKYIIGKSDFKLAEVWDQRIGVPLWHNMIRLFAKVGEDPVRLGLNFVFMELGKLRVNTFNEAMQEILGGTGLGGRIIKSIAEKIKYNKERDEFDDYMDAHIDNQPTMLTDDEGECFTPEQLLSDDICAQNTLDED